ncbi:aldehyde dehydrogenase (NAD+)/succinate-semialdehyde dehydrogenase/glutarate-semialdehyde dehydrogenase [Actinocorallia herbida]|uniref:Aldehyde dehydrogenase (NAD+)/succinate-semialdehyde dehydrogenase/glutarate-semialdehyde dehydrogenase n=2 Tax=Actinocorallia herbida TaxID=58109 RepID=A0A3N1D9J2_9ACTN|nr:aldehyde dehydrogenase (NAD+)/succinate-semialdehyde dehydrogenase/glutarate-semialdehyde dehydrogenase [Actinocorallia herbida]
MLTAMATQTASPSPLSDAAIAKLTALVTSDGGSTVINAPFTGEPLAVIPTSSAEDVENAYAKARAAQRAWAELSPAERAEPVLRFVDAFLARRDEILDILQWETGKARRHAFEEFLDVSLGSLYYARKAPKLLGAKRRQGAFPLMVKTRELRQPKGVIGMITPWNYPISMGVGDTVPALLAGNAVVHKPDTQTALSVLWCVALMIECGLPKDLWQIVAGDPAEIGDPIIEAADYIAFTGSTRAGRQIAAKAAPRLIGYSLELGGKNPMIVLEDADLKLAARGAVRACFSNAGQLCISIERLLVHEKVFDDFLAAFKAETEAMKLGSALDFDAQMGSLTHQRQLDTVSAHVEQAVAAGATLVAGGKARPDLGPLFYEPTILTDVTTDMDLCAGETFGPVVSVYRFATEDEAVTRANDTSYGLNASVWTRDLARGRRVGARLQAGTVNVNEGYGAAMASHDAPMGGMKQSGVGRRHGAEGMLRYTEAQTVASQQFMELDAPANVPYAKYADLLTGAIKTLKRFHLK